MIEPSSPVPSGNPLTDRAGPAIQPLPTDIADGAPARDGAAPGVKEGEKGKPRLVVVLDGLVGW